MLILGITTSTQQVGVAIGGHEGILALHHCARGRQHAETLAPAIEFTCRQARVGIDEIGAVAVDVGPGLFTGLRVGVAAAKAIAFGRNVPMIGVSSLDLLAFRVRFTHRPIVAAIDARRGELFAATYREAPGGVQRVDDHQICTPDDLANQLLAARADTLLVGDGALRYAETFGGLDKVEIADQGFAHPSAGALVLIAHAHALREDFVTPREIEPMYLRKPDAEINWIQRDGQGPGQAASA